MHPFIANFACYGCGLEQHLCDEFGQQVQVHCDRCGTMHFINVSKRGDIGKVVVIGKDLVMGPGSPPENCNSEPLLPVSLPPNPSG
jgi:hypothetical protein